jgi:hypothetical protein
VPLLQPTVGNTINNVSKVASVGTKVAGLATTAMSAGPGFVGSLGQDVGEQAVQQATEVAQAQERGTTIGAVQAAAQTAAAQRQGQSGQSGGGIESTGPGPIIAGALTALILAGGLKGFHDFLSKQIN